MPLDQLATCNTSPKIPNLKSSHVRHVLSFRTAGINFLCDFLFGRLPFLLRFLNNIVIVINEIAKELQINREGNRDLQKLSSVLFSNRKSESKNNISTNYFNNNEQ